MFDYQRVVTNAIKDRSQLTVGYQEPLANAVLFFGEMLIPDPKYAKHAYTYVLPSMTQTMTNMSKIAALTSLERTKWLATCAYTNTKEHRFRLRKGRAKVIVRCGNNEMLPH